MMQKFLLAGMLSGLLVAVVAFSYARIFSEPSVELAIAFEEHHAHVDDGHPGEELVSRTTQRNLGLFTGIASYCVALGGLLAIGVAALRGRVHASTKEATWLLVATGYVSIVLVPQIAYPASPPGVGSAETIDARTELFFVMILASVLCMASCVWFAVQIGRRLDPVFSIPTGAIAYAALASVLVYVVPPISEVPEDYPRGLLFEFRVHSFLLQLIVWCGLGLAFGQAADYVAGRRVSGDTRRGSVPNA